MGMTREDVILEGLSSDDPQVQIRARFMATATLDIAVNFLVSEVNRGTDPEDLMNAVCQALVSWMAWSLAPMVGDDIPGFVKMWSEATASNFETSLREVLGDG